MKTLILVLCTFFLIGCSNKHLSVQSLHPSLIPDAKIYNVILEEFENDYINQANHIEEKLVNKTINGKRVFQMQRTYQNIDAIVTGKVLESSLHYDTYYKRKIDYDRCKKYEYKNGKRTNKCLKYRKLKIPCEKREYKVRTQVQVLNKHESLIFSKVYTQKEYKTKCYENRYNYSPFIVNNRNLNREQNHIHSKLARKIAQNIINDISPSYKYENITIIENLETSYAIDIKEEFKTIVELLDNGNINISQTKLHRLNKKLRYQSHEVLYNLALTYEANKQLKRAQEYYEEARIVCKKLENLKLIQEALQRVQKNLSDKIKAKSQLQ